MASSVITYKQKPKQQQRYHSVLFKTFFLHAHWVTSAPPLSGSSLQHKRSLIWPNIPARRRRKEGVWHQTGETKLHNVTGGWSSKSDEVEPSTFSENDPKARKEASPKQSVGNQMKDGVRCDALPGRKRVIRLSSPKSKRTCWVVNCSLKRQEQSGDAPDVQRLLFWDRLHTQPLL